jgi:hypothetical protein
MFVVMSRAGEIVRAATPAEVARFLKGARDWIRTHLGDAQVISL